MTGGIAPAFKQRIGWRWLGVALSVAIIGYALLTLYHLLHDIELAKVVAALQATSWKTIAVAGLLVAASYVALTFYDFFALRTIGRRHVPYRIAALTGFASYTIGHNLGATVFTGGIVRYRIYSAWGLTLIDVAKVAFVTGLTFWLGNAVVLGLGVAWAPEAASAVNRLPAWINQAIALVVLSAIGGYLVWLVPRPRVIGRSQWSVTLPGAPLTLVQIGIGVLDLGLAGLAMYALLPAGSATDFVTLTVIFVLATLLGFISHAPGSIGVFDALMLIGLASLEKEQLLAALLIFRTLYFVLPFLTAVVALGIRELWMAVAPR